MLGMFAYFFVLVAENQKLVLVGLLKKTTFVLKP